MGKVQSSPCPGEPKIKGGMLAAWRFGFQAAQNGQPIEANQYAEMEGAWGRTYRKRWREGWEAGRATPRELVVAQARRCNHCEALARPGTGNCAAHRNWKRNQRFSVPVRQQQRERRAQMDRTPCATCGTLFKATSHNSKFCDFEHDPGLILLEDRLDLARKYPGCEERWAAKYRDMVRRHK